MVAYFINKEGVNRTLLLALPALDNEHSGVNIAAQVSAIIKEFKIGDKISDFVLDNAFNNDTGMEELAKEFGFNWEHRRLRCIGHIINLIARQLLFRTDFNLFKAEAVLKKSLKDKVAI